MKSKMQTNKVDVSKVGYSDQRLQPCYLIYTTLFFLALPIFGTLTAFILVTVPAFMIALKVAEIERSDPVAEAARWQSIRDMYAAIEERDRLAQEQADIPIVIREKGSTLNTAKPTRIIPQTSFAR